MDSLEERVARLERREAGPGLHTRILLALIVAIILGCGLLVLGALVYHLATGQKL